MVIVGTNGSGKTTVLKLLSCLYRPNSGSILVDGELIETHETPRLRDSTVVLTQKHQLFPLAISENIVIGDPLHGADEGMISEAASRKGGEGLSKNLKTEMDHLMELRHSASRFWPFTRFLQLAGSGHIRIRFIFIAY